MCSSWIGLEVAGLFWREGVEKYCIAVVGREVDLLWIKIEYLIAPRYHAIGEMTPFG